MWHRLVLLILLTVPAYASADAIMPFEGECFPGSRRGMSNHAEACIPIVCEQDAACGEGASCVTLCVCRAEREFTSNGRVVYDEPRREVVEVGLCDEQGACAEGDTAERRQCEPNLDTPAFDRDAHRWTGQSHPSGAGVSGACGGCAVPGRGQGWPWAGALGLAGVALWLGRRS